MSEPTKSGTWPGLIAPIGFPAAGSRFVETAGGAITPGLPAGGVTWRRATSLIEAVLLPLFQMRKAPPRRNSTTAPVISQFMLIAWAGGRVTVGSGVMSTVR